MIDFLRDLFSLINKIFDIFKRSEEEREQHEVNEIIDKRQKSQNSDRPPDDSWGGIRQILLFALFLPACSHGMPSTLTERKILWPSSLICSKWIKPDGFSYDGPMLLAVIPRDDLPLQNANKQSCFSPDDVLKLESRLAELLEKLKACQSR